MSTQALNMRAEATSLRRNVWIKNNGDAVMDDDVLKKSLYSKMMNTN